MVGRMFIGKAQIMFQYVKIKSHILELMEVEIISWTIYMITDYQCLIIDCHLNNLFK